MRSASLLTCLIAVPFAGLAGCYTTEFDDNAGGVYYCAVDSDCNTGQACQAFACVDDSGPEVQITGPELLQNLASDTTDLTVNYALNDFTISDSDERIEGQGKVRVSIVGTDVEETSVLEQGAQLDITGLTPGAYRLVAEAVYGDGSAYENPSASTYTVFYLEADNPERPQAAIVEPSPTQVHVVNEPLDVVVAARNFTFVGSGEDCRIDADCDPWGPEGDLCIPDAVDECELDPSGHAHVYFLDDYPDCLNDEITCNGKYVMSMRPGDNVESDGVTVSATLPASRFEEPGTYTFSIGLQYNDHEPYPGPNFVIYDQFTIEVVE